MIKYNPEIHHRRSIRLKNYDYSKKGLYFLTLCCRECLSLLGEIVCGEMNLNDKGIITKSCWNEIPTHFPNIVLHEFTIMPNHIHGIIEITESVEVENFQPLQSKQQYRNEFQHIIPHSVGSIVRGFKISARQNK